ncbi:undecaprenyl-diphosphate phosphatase [Parachlamydia sp. AcF125]|uniref:undecaprenyl-diphosphate phosphatase n=1 Tax=Parachlamydia sp. AcF125 TaxID=2795736 RepID=UPI001BCA62C9|nr:undecaprenyl-diphosphate phosphatase [Parachlamydia sp. AcF125]MBS4167550.1 Undecaprenyl-diphosphatase [Parachlamydia sp. AcF125]
MSILEAIFLGIIQGLTEFLPVSSSGHLKLMQSLIGFQNLDQYILFDLICHLGTLGAIFIFFAKEIKETLTSNRLRLLQIALATLPLFPLAIFLKPIESIYQKPHLLGFFFLITSFLLFLGVYCQKEGPSPPRWRTPFLIGCFQALAIFPGISRSGATISGAKLLGWRMHEALTFSFLIAIPAIVGGIVLETLKFITTNSVAPPVPIPAYCAGLLASLCVGYASLFFLQKMALPHRFLWFAWYCLALGVFAIIYYNF